MFQSLVAAARYFFSKLQREGVRTNWASQARKLIFGESPVAQFREHLRIVRSFGTHQARALYRQLPNLPNKYFSAYLANSFDKKDRRDILLHHNRFLACAANDDFYADIVGRAHPLWQMNAGQRRFQIALSVNDKWHSEGDLSLTFLDGGLSLFQISFTIVPGRLIGSNAQDVLLVGRVQGAKHRLEEIRSATRLCQDIAPQYLLMAAVQAVAQGFSLTRIVGVSNKEKLDKGDAAAPRFAFDYDFFWETFLPLRSGRFFELPVPLPRKPIEQTPLTHRRRTRRKREFKAEVARLVQAAFAGKFVRRSESPVAALLSQAGGSPVAADAAPKGVLSLMPGLQN